MNNNLLRFALVAGLFAATVSIARDGKDHSAQPAAPAASGQLVTPADRDAAWLVKARESYPPKTCLVSNKELGGSMGETIDRIYREKGKPDRLVRFCCESCLDDFKAEPAKYLRKLDEPAKPKANPSKHQH